MEMVYGMKHTLCPLEGVEREEPGIFLFFFINAFQSNYIDDSLYF